VLKSGNFIERSIMGAFSFLKESVFAEEYALKKGFLQSLDPRVKSISFCLFIIQILLTKNILTLLCLYGICISLALFSRVSLWFFLKRTWVFIPLFSLFIALPALFSIFTPGEALGVLHIGHWQLTVTRQGLAGATLFFTRVLTSVSFVILLSLTTRHFAFLKVLRIFGIPQVFVMTMGMCYRYIFLFIELIENTYLAVKSRVGIRVKPKSGRNIAAWNIAALWLRSCRLNEDVYMAMLSRGYRGEPVTLNELKTKPRDWLWLAAAAAIISAIGCL